MPTTDLTPYADVNATLADLLERVCGIAGSRFFGMYLYGSLAAGDFDPGRSDIDVLVVTDGELPETMVTDLARMHEALFVTGSKWAKKLEGTCLPLPALRVFRRDDPPRLTINEGRVYLDRHWSDWVIQRAILRVSADDLRQAVREILAEWWAPMLDHPRRLHDPGYQPFAVLSMCRALHTIKHGTILRSRLPAAGPSQTSTAAGRN